MKKLSVFFWLIVIILISSHYTPVFSQKMKVIRVAVEKIAGDKGSNDGVAENQKYTIYRETSAGLRTIGTAQVFVVKSSVCGLNILYNQPDYLVKTGDILVIMEDSPIPPVAPAVALTDPPDEKTPSTNKGRIGIRGGIGTDVSGGLVFGGSLNYLLPTYSNPFELGFVVFTGRFEETTEDVHTYLEQTEILVFGLFGNYLINYNQRSNGLFFLVGTGIGYIEVALEESSETDESLGPLLPGGGSRQFEEASAFGFIFDLGFGYKFSNNIDARFEAPVFIITSSPGETSSVVPTFVFSLGVRFN
jgi:hypothetical protein